MAQPIIPTITAADQQMAISTLVDDTLGRWNGTSSKGTGAVVQYSFGLSVPSYTNQYLDTYPAQSTFQSFSEDMKATARSALAAWSAVTNISFVEVSDSASVGMRFFSLSNMNTSTAGFAWGAGTGSSIGSSMRGDVWVNRALTDSTELKHVLLHEIGHTMGLKHPHESPVMSSTKDSTQTTIMSYDHDYFNDVQITYDQYGTNFSLNRKFVTLEEEGGYSHLGIFDIAAIQSVYGKKVDSNPNTYKFSSSAFTAVLYDGGGSDVIDLSNQSFGSILNMNAGSFSSIGLRTVSEAVQAKMNELPAQVRTALGDKYITNYISDYSSYIYLGKDNLSIAFDTLIESAIGSAYADTITGNDADNTITGGAGNDTINGGAGIDTAKFSGSYSSGYRVAKSNGVVIVAGTDGTDTLTNVERLVFDDGTIITTDSITATSISSPVYRFYNKTSGTHFYTADAQERVTVTNKFPNFSFEGVAFNAFDTAFTSNYSAVYRFYNKETGTHFYTISSSERESVSNLAKYSYDGVSYYASTATGAGLDPLYRFYNTNTGVHFYTASETERAAVSKLVGFVYEGVAYYVDA